MSLLTTLSTSLKHEEEIRRNIIKIKNELINHQISSMCVFRRVPIDYYDKTLGERGALLQCRPEQLCKSILFENTLCNHNNCEDIHDSRYYVVVVQYIRKINTDLLSAALSNLMKEKKNKLKYNFRLVSEGTSYQLTSYQHNAVTVYGMNRKIPVVICSNIMNVSPSFVYLGGGSVDVKLGLPTSLLASSTNAIVALISKLREEDNSDD